MAQSIKINYKPGSVSKEELEMDSYPLDTAASAVLLCKKEDVKVSFNSNLEIKRTVTVYKRYKVLKDAGKDCADASIYYYSNRDYDEKVYGLKVVTHNLVDGKKVSSKMPSSLVYKDSFSETLNQMKFSAPDVRVGSVIEVQYTFSSSLYSDVGLLFIQEDYPVNHAELNIEYAEYFQFNKLMRGYHSLMDVKQDYTSEVVAVSGGAVLRFNMNNDIFIANDVPANKEESFCFYPDQSRLGVEYDLRLLNIPGAVYKNFSVEWADVDKDFVERGLLNEFKAKTPLNKKIAAEVEGITDEVEVIKAVRKGVLAAVKWNKDVSRWPDVRKAIKEASGDSADLCGIMASVLNSMGYETSPVLIKTRDRGVLASFHVTGESFNVVILQIVTPSGKVYYTDVVRNHAYLNVLPVKYLVPNARLLSISNSKGSWVDLSTLTPNSDTQNVVAKLSADGSIEGEFSRIAANVSSLDFKDHVSSYKNNDEYIEELQNDLGVEITDYEFPDNVEWAKRSLFHFKYTGEAEVAGDYIYVKPFIKKFHSERSFQDAERRSAVDIPYTETLKYSYTLFIPEGYVVDQLPQNQGFAYGPLNSKVIVRYQTVGDSGLTVTYIFMCGSTFVLPEEYTDFRSFWAELCNIYNATIVLKKK